MVEVSRIAAVAALAGDPARVNMLLALSDGRALPAGELAFQARVAPATASGHLAQMVAGGLLTVAAQGRHRYYRLASAQVAAMLESMLTLAADAETTPVPRVRCRADSALREARTCYNHLAGRLGVALADSLAASGHLTLGDDGGEVTASGFDFFAAFGLDLGGTRGRTICRTCIDWSERRLHLSGHLGAALCRRCLELGWIERQHASRAIAVTARGREGFCATFGLTSL